MRRWVNENALSLFFFTILIGALVGQSVAGHSVYNEEQADHDGRPISYGRYLVSSHFGRAVMENWQSEYLQFTLFILATVWLVQKGSAESKKPGDAGRESDAQQKIGGYADRGAAAWAKVRGFRLWLYSNSLLLVMTTIFLLSWTAHALTGWTDYNQERAQHDDPPIGLAGYLVNPQFWEETLQNWQSEFLAVGTMAVFTIYLRQRGSPESKRVGTAHDETGSEA